MFQSSFELTSYITEMKRLLDISYNAVSKLFRAYELYNYDKAVDKSIDILFQSSFELTSYITE